MAGEEEELRDRVAAGKYKKLALCGQDDVASNVDLLNDIFKHLDAVSLAMASCVSKKWKQATDDEGLWEAICTRHWPASTASAPQTGQLKSVVVALGGFKRLYVNSVHPLLSRNNSSCKRLKSFSTSKGGSSSSKQKWSKDEVYLSLSLFSIDCYERIAPLPSLSSRMGAGALCKPFLDEQRHASASTAFNSDVRHFLEGWRGKCSVHPPKENDNTTRKTGINAEDANYCWGSMDFQSSPK